MLDADALWLVERQPEVVAGARWLDGLVWDDPLVWDGLGNWRVGSYMYVYMIILDD